MTPWAARQANAPDDLEADVEVAENTVAEIVDQQLYEGEELGESADRDQEVVAQAADAILERSSTFANTYDGANLSAALLVAGKQAFDDIATISADPQAVYQQNERLLSALDESNYSEVREGFSQSFRAPPTSDADSDDESASSDDIGSLIDTDSHPHVSTAEAQHAAAVAPPVAPAPGVAAVAQNLVLQQMAAVPARPPRTGTLAQGPPPLNTAARVTTLTENLEEAPLVAALVQRGLLKTEDVLSKPYVQAMEKKLREQQLTKEVQGRDVRYRSARAAYRPPVNVVTTATPGVYRYQRPRFAR